ncbi:MAG: ABC transporter permease [Candidatus Sumerlaeia bacterium]|nr:ABC transporter permease [Candidatus Sumerlaeia bacterium]
MTTYILRRLLELIPTMLGVTILTFALMRLSPGDPVRLMLGPEATEESITAKSVELGYERYVGGVPGTARVLGIERGNYLILHVIPNEQTDFDRERLIRLHVGEAANPLVGRFIEHEDFPVSNVIEARVSQTDVYQIGVDLDVMINRTLVKTNVVTQYFYWLGGVIRGDLGTSITSGRPVTEEIFRRMPATIELALVSMIFAILTGIIVGVLSAVYPRSILDNTSRFIVFVFLAMPSFWLGLELIILFSRNIPLFPPAGRGDPWTPQMVSHLVLPAITLGVSTGAFLCRILRSSMLQVLSMDYVRTARAKGLDSNRVILKHALKNAMIPFVTVAGLSTGALLGGSVIVETVFNWPGVGKLMIDSIRGRDFPVTMGAVLILAFIFVLVNLLVDLLYSVLDPRIRLEGSAK